MTYYKHHKDKDGSCSARGEKAETLFSKSLHYLGFTLDEAEFQDQMKHIDFYFTIEGSVDVKARKRLSRSGGDQDEYVWVEFLGTTGRKGWLYGQQTHMAFERLRDFVVVPRAELATLCEAIVEDEIVTNVADAHLRKYSRRNCKSLCSLIPMKTITKRLPVILLKKYDDEKCENSSD